MTVYYHFSVPQRFIKNVTSKPLFTKDGELAQVLITFKVLFTTRVFLFVSDKI